MDVNDVWSQNIDIFDLNIENHGTNGPFYCGWNANSYGNSIDKVNEYYLNLIIYFFIVKFIHITFSYFEKF